MQLVCIDVDGTLIGRSGVVLPVVWIAAARARDAGIRLAICSGRPGFGDALGYAERLDGDGWHIFQNGASVVRLPSRTSRSIAIPADAVAELIEQSRDTGCVLELYTDDGYAVESTDRRAREHAALLGLPFKSRPFDSLSGPIIRALWLCGAADVADIRVGSPPGLELGMATSPPMPETVFINVTPRGVNKAVAVRAVAQAYGVPLSHVMYVGDGHVDVGPMREVGVSVAMGNAESDVAAAARHHVASVDRGGLADALVLAVTGVSA